MADSTEMFLGEVEAIRADRFESLLERIASGLELLIKTKEPESLVDKEADSTSIHGVGKRCTCGYHWTSGKGKMYMISNEFGVCPAHSVIPKEPHFSGCKVG